MAYRNTDEHGKHTKEASHEISYIEKFHLYERSKQNKFMETESKLMVNCEGVVERPWGETHHGKWVFWGGGGNENVLKLTEIRII